MKIHTLWWNKCSSNYSQKNVCCKYEQYSIRTFNKKIGKFSRLLNDITPNKFLNKGIVIQQYFNGKGLHSWCVCIAEKML